MVVQLKTEKKSRMKSQIFTVITIISLAVLQACSGKSDTLSTSPSKEGSNQHAEHQHSTAKATTPQTTVLKSAGPVINSDHLQALYDQYAQLTTALVNNNLPEASIAANALEAGARQYSSGGTIAGLAAQINSANTIHRKRASYAPLSKEMIRLVKKEGLSSGELYVDYCPMVFNDKGASWLSHEKAILNPYFGAAMLTCGELKETLD